MATPDSGRSRTPGHAQDYTEAPPQDHAPTRAGWALRALALVPRGHAMHGYGLWQNRAREQRSPLYARALYLDDGDGRGLFFCCLDTGYITHAMREGVVTALKCALGDTFSEERLVLTCTHTHSGPGGCSHDGFYNIVTPGFVPEHLDAVVNACRDALLEARHSAAPTELRLTAGSIAATVPVAWNRSLRAWRRNPEATPLSAREAHLAIEREMQVLGCYRDGQLCALLSLFGVHATCVGNSHNAYDGDNKGYAAASVEATLRAQGVAAPVAIFAQATAGDVSPYYHGPGQAAARRKIRGEAEFDYARANGEHQARHALALLAQGGTRVQGPFDGVLTYVDFARQTAAPRFTGGIAEAATSDPCHGTAFFRGTPVDGPGMPAVLGVLAGGAARLLRSVRLSPLAPLTPEARAYYRHLYAAQGPKPILLESGRKRILGQRLEHLALPDIADPMVRELKQQARRGALRDSALVPTVLPVQLLRLGDTVLVCAPGEFTTVAGARLRAAVASELAGHGITRLWLCTYCNDYMGYVTTREEYQAQAYEGGHTIFGQWTLAAFQTRFAALATQLARPPQARSHDRDTRPAPAPAEELALRSNLPVPALA